MIMALLGFRDGGACELAVLPRASATGACDRARIRWPVRLRVSWPAKCRRWLACRRSSGRGPVAARALVGQGGHGR